MGKTNKPRKWVNVYPQGTPEGDEEQKFFIALGRHTKWEWRSVAHLSKESGLTKLRIEQLLDKYQREGMVFQNPTNEVYWGYWERVPHMLPKKDPSVVKKDQDERLKKVLGSRSQIQQTKALPSLGMSNYDDILFSDQWNIANAFIWDVRKHTGSKPSNSG